jgi:hypothetical protein
VTWQDRQSIYYWCVGSKALKINVEDQLANNGIPLEPYEVATFLLSTPVVLRELLHALPAGAATWHPGAGKWCIQEVVGHLVEADTRDFVGRIRLMLDQDEPRLTVNDQEEVARKRHDCDKNLDDLLDEFSTVRGASVSLVSALKGGELRRGGVHPKIGHLRITHLLHDWIYHDLNHISQIRANLQGVLWAHLGNMQKFYQS